MKKLTQDIKHALGALAAANAGEMLNRRAKNRYLAPQQTSQPQPVAAAAPAVTPPAPKRQQVALWLREIPGKAVMSYTLATCQRMDMELVIIHAGKLRAQALLAEHGDALAEAGVKVDIQAIDNAEEETLYRHIERNTRIAFLVMDSPDAILKPQAATGQRRAAVPPVPLVVVTTPQTETDTIHTDQAIAA